MKKHILSLLTICTLQASNADLNPEDYHFTKTETVKTWVNSNIKPGSDLFTALQQNLVQFLPQQPVPCIRTIPRNPSQKTYYGKAFPTNAAIELPFLQFVHSLRGAPITLELGAGLGYVSWKLPWAMEGGQQGTHIVNDLCQEAINETIPSLCEPEKGFVPKDTLNKIEYDLGDLFDILKRRPTLAGKVNAIMVQNVEHFFNPEQHQRFLTLISTLLSDNGKVFLCCHTHGFTWSADNQLAALYHKRKTLLDTYPGFMQYTTVFHQLKGRPECIKRADLDSKDFDASRPKDNATHVLETIGKPKPVSTCRAFGQLFEILRIEQRTQVLNFDPETYRVSASLHPELSCTDTFFTNRVGAKIPNWSVQENPQDSTHAAAILQKKTTKEITPKDLITGTYTLLCHIRANNPDVWQKMQDAQPVKLDMTS